MREIKFRVWDGKRMKTTSIGVSSDGYVKTDKGSILMQYTGLKDKNGKEIYEGDIVKWKDTDGGIVKWGYDSWQIDYDKGRKQFLSDHWELSEVIGNIYENKVKK